MSLLVFPAFTFGQWDYQFPIKQTPLFKTITQTPASGRGELRIPLMQFPRWDFVFDISFLMGDATTDNSAWQQFTNFYMAVFGAASDWLFTHPFDNTVTDQVIGTGDGITTEFTMFRTLVTSGAEDLIQNFQAPPSIYLSGVLQDSDTYDINQYGTLTFNTAPDEGVTISWTGAFYYLCHFMTDSFDSLQLELKAIWSNHEVKFRSILL